MRQGRQKLLESEAFWILSAVLILAVVLVLGLKLISGLILFVAPRLMHQFALTAVQTFVIAVVAVLVQKGYCFLRSKFEFLLSESSNEESAELIVGSLTIVSTLVEYRIKLLLPPKPQLDWFFPEECVADLEALHQRIQAECKKHWLRKVIMFRAVVESFWAFYIQIKIENLTHPRKVHTNQLED